MASSSSLETKKRLPAALFRYSLQRKHPRSFRAYVHPRLTFGDTPTGSRVHCGGLAATHFARAQSTSVASVRRHWSWSVQTASPVLVSVLALAAGPAVATAGSMNPGAAPGPRDDALSRDWRRAASILTWTSSRNDFAAESARTGKPLGHELPDAIRPTIRSTALAR